MSQVQSFKIPKTADAKLIACFKRVLESHKQELGVKTVNITAAGYSRIGSVDLFDLENANEDFKALMDFKSSLISSLQFSVSGFAVIFTRSGFQNIEASSIYDFVSINVDTSQGPPQNSVRISIAAQLIKELKVFESGKAIQGDFDQQNNALAIHEAVLTRLEDLNEDLIRKSSEFRDRVDEKYQADVERLNAGYVDKSKLLDKEHQDRLNELTYREEQINQKLKLIDDRNNTHARREIRDKMLADVKSRISSFGVSQATSSKRRPVFWGMMVLVGVLALALLGVGYQLFYYPLDSSRELFLWVKFSFLTLGLASAILYYIKWENSWAEKHASSEFQLQQFYLDINRSNWVIESCLEWRKETDSAIPGALIESITNGLFEGESTNSESVIHPSDELASALMGSASKMKLKFGDSELEFDKPKNIPRSKVTNQA